MPKMSIGLKRVVFSKVVKNLEKATLFAFLTLLTILFCLLPSNYHPLLTILRFLILMVVSSFLKESSSPINVCSTVRFLDSSPPNEID